MQLWTQWWWCVQALRPACARWRTFAGMVLVLVGLSVRSDLAGVTSFVRAVGLRPKVYRRLLHLFHCDGLDLEALTMLWCSLALKLFTPVCVDGRLVCLADGLKAAKEGRKMPGVKKLHQESQDNSKPEYIMGHSFQAISLLASGPAQCFVAVPLISRIHEGLLWSRNCKRTLLDKMAGLFLQVATALDQPLILVADAYYASRKMILPLLKKGHHLVTRLRITAVAYHAAQTPEKRKRGHPKLYGEKVKLRELAKDTATFIAAASPVYGENGVELTYRCIDLLWRPIGRLARFVIVRHPTRGVLFLLSSDTNMNPLDIIALYGYRFKIEVGFRQALHVIGAYAYHFWMKTMTPIRKNDGNQKLYNKSAPYRCAVRRKLKAYHVYVQLACIAQGLLQHLALNCPSQVWRQFRSWLRTMNTHRPPSELVVAYALRNSMFEFLGGIDDEHNLKEILLENMDPDQVPQLHMVA